MDENHDRKDSENGVPQKHPILVPEGKMRCGACNVILSHDEWEAHKDTTEHLINAGMALREVVDECVKRMDEIERFIIVR